LTTFLIAFVIAGLNPFGGMFVAIPIGMFKLGWPAWMAVALAIPLAYVQVLGVDLMWNRLLAWPAWMRVVERRRSKKLDALLARQDAGLWLALLSPWLGPWLVMAVARFSGKTLRNVGLPLFFGLVYVAIAAGAVCVVAPDWLPK